MPRMYWTRGGTMAAIIGVTALVASVVTVFVTGAFAPATAEPGPQDRRSADKLEYHFDKTLCGAMDWSVAEAVVPLADDVDAADSKSAETKTITVECSVLLKGHPESQIYLNVTTFASEGEAKNAYQLVGKQQKERVDDLTELEGEWDRGHLGTGNKAYDVYTDALVQDSNAAGSVVLSLSGDSVTDAAAQTKAAQQVVAELAAEMLDVLRRG